MCFRSVFSSSILLKLSGDGVSKPSSKLIFSVNLAVAWEKNLRQKGQRF